MCVCPQRQTLTSNTHSNFYTSCIYWESLRCAAVAVAAWPGGLPLLGSQYCCQVGAFVAHSHRQCSPCGSQMDCGRYCCVIPICHVRLHSSNHLLVRHPLLGRICLQEMFAGWGLSHFGWVGHCTQVQRCQVGGWQRSWLPSAA
jgi:hypothetical protein